MEDVRDAFDSASERPLPLRMRPDLAIHAQESGSARSWVVKDPVALTYFQLREEELAILRMLDGRTSLGQIKRRFEARFAPLQLHPEQLLGFLNRLHESGLLVADAPGQGEQLMEQHLRRGRRVTLDSLVNVLAIRLGSIDPEPLLRWLAPKCAWLFSFWFLAGCLAITVSAAVLAAVQFDVLRSRLPDFQTFFAAGNLVWLAVALVIAKALHELGHALTCKHFGGECHEIGVLLLVFTPCLYCNVSDAWLFPSKWQRIGVSAAGILVEVVLAALCTLLWWLTGPGLLNALLLNIVVVCSVSTILFNGNPLLRYDGYYILSDLLGVPNLGQQSRALIHRGMSRWLLGIESPEVDRSLPEARRPLLVLYGVASVLYRWFVVIAILWLCYQVTKLWGLELLGGLIAVVTLAGMIVPPLRNLARFVRNPANRRRIRRGRALTAGILLAGLAGGVLLVPLPYRIKAPVVLQPQEARHVYVTVPGRVAESVAAGALVDENGELARLVNLDLRKEVVELTGQWHQQRLHLQNLRARQSDPSAASQIPAAEEALADIEKRLRQRQDDEKRLVLRAPVRGTVIPPPRQPDQFYKPGSLGAWKGTPLEPRTAGTYVEVGSLLCLIGDPSRLDALLVIDQSDMKFVREGQRVRMQLDEMPGRVLHGTIVELAKTDLKIAPRELTQQSDLVIHFDREGVPRPVANSYQARVVLDEGDHRLLVGTRGRAKILVDPQPVALRLYRWARYLFHFGS